MATRSERDRCKGLQEKHQAILSELLKEEDNKYCVDCDAKGPRWGSWNLGVFLCIRCAGIHRNLGVHISKVKSVNLDTWTLEQLGMVQEMGNSRARAVYEANLPDHFRRPQTDSRTLEAFIRAKYEQKKYIAKEWVPPQLKVPGPVANEEKKEKKKAHSYNRSRPSSSAAANMQLSGVSPSHRSVKNVKVNVKPASSVTAAQSNLVIPKTPAPGKKNDSNMDDLIGLESTVAAPSTNNNDIFSDFISASTEPAAPQSSSSTAVTGTGGSLASEGLEPSLFGDTSANSNEPPKSTKDSIMALFGSAPQQPQQQQQQQQQQPQQNFAVSGGMYLNQQQLPNMQNVQNMANLQIGNTMPGTMPGALPGSMPVSMAGAMPVSMAGAMPVSMAGTMPVSMAGSMPVSMAGSMPVSMTGTMPVSMAGGMSNGMQNGMMAGGNMMGNMGMMGVPAGNNMMAQGMQQPAPLPIQHNLMVVDPMTQLRTNLIHNMVYPEFLQGQVMMGPMGPVPVMQTGQMMAGQALPPQMGQIAPPSYSVAAGQGLFNIQQQPPTAVSNQQFQQLANQMAGMQMGVQTVGGFPAGGGIAAGGGSAMWGTPQPGQTLSTNLWQ